MGGGPGRLEIIAAMVLIAGVVLCARGSWRLATAMRGRFTYGAPYRHGTIQDRLLGLVLEIPILLLGAALGFLALGQADFQANEKPIRVGRIEARRAGWGKIRVRFIPDPLYPGRQVREGEIAGARWAVVGDFITWDAGVKWLGFTDGHRVRYLFGTNDTTGLTPELQSDKTVLEPLPGAAFRLLSMARYIPFLTVRTESTRWFPLADAQVMVLYAIGPGYLVDSAASGSGAARSSQGAAY